MKLHSPVVFDHTAMIDLFAGHRVLGQMLDGAERGEFFLVFPTAAIAAAEWEIKVGLRLWSPFLRTRGLSAVPLAEHVAIEAGSWSRSIEVNQVVYEAQAIHGVVVTRMPDLYEGFDVPVYAV